MTRCTDWRFNLPDDDSELRSLYDSGVTAGEAAIITDTQVGDVAMFFRFIEASRQPGDNYL